MSDPSAVTAFEDSIKARLREHVGTLMPDEMLSKLVEKAIQDLFFTRNVKKESGYYGREVETPSWFEAECKSLLSDRIRKEIQAYFDRNGDVLIQGCAEEITKQAPQLMAEVVVQMFQSAMVARSFNFAQALEQRLQAMSTR